MPLTRAQRVRLARVLRWSRSDGWQHDVYPNTWRSADSAVHIRYDTADEQLVVTWPAADPLRCRCALIPVADPDQALRVLAALGYLPPDLASPVESEPPPEVEQAADAFDGPASFAEAGQAFADLVDGRVMPDRAAEVLSHLARSGLIISVAFYDESVGSDAGCDADLARVLNYPTAS